MSLNLFFELSTALLYFLASVIYVAGVLGANSSLKRVALWALGLGFLLHSLDLILNLASNPAFAASQGHFYISLLAWTFLLLYLLVWWRLKIHFLALTAAPLALILFSSSMLVHTPTIAVPAQLSGLWFSLHIAALFVSIALLALAFGAGICYRYVDWQIKHKTKPGRLRKDFPALLSCDRINHWAVSVGFPLFTIGMLAGFLWADFTWDQAFSWDPKELSSVIIWFLFAFLFYQRLALGWKGRKPANLASWIFVLCLVSMVVINFFLPTHHSLRP